MKKYKLILDEPVGDNGGVVNFSFVLPANGKLYFYILPIGTGARSATLSFTIQNRKIVRAERLILIPDAKKTIPISLPKTPITLSRLKPHHGKGIKLDVEGEGELVKGYITLPAQTDTTDKVQILLQYEN